MRHLFLAPLGSAFGEALQGIRLAAGLRARGHDVVFLAPAKLHALVESVPVTFGRIDMALPRLDEQLPGLLRRLRCDTLVLVDAAAVGKVVRALGLAPAAFTRADVPVIALDCWNLPEIPSRWDYGSHSETLSPEFHRLPLRLLPVPVAPPDVEGGFAALPALPELSGAARRRARDELGLSDDDRLIVWPSATWQHAENHTHPALSRLAGALPGLILPHLAKLGPRVKILHVGPLPFAPAGTPGYRFMPQVEPGRFERLVSSADLLLSFNAVATSLATGVAARVPIVLGTTAIAAASEDEAARALGARLAPAVRAWIAANLPLHPMRAWPLGLDTLLRATLADNPFYTAMRVADPLDQDGFVNTCNELLFEPAAAAALRQRQEDYRQRVRSLPSGTERFLSLLEGK
jgi:uncharacterized protein DUF6365